MLSRRNILGAALMSRNRPPTVFFERMLIVATVFRRLEPGRRICSALGCFGPNQHNSFPRQTLGGVAGQIQIEHCTAIRSSTLSLHPSLFIASRSHAALLRTEADLNANRRAENLGYRLLEKTETVSFASRQAHLQWSHRPCRTRRRRIVGASILFSSSIVGTVSASISSSTVRWLRLSSIAGSDGRAHATAGRPPRPLQRRLKA